MLLYVFVEYNLLNMLVNVVVVDDDVNKNLKIYIKRNKIFGD